MNEQDQEEIKKIEEEYYKQDNAKWDYPYLTEEERIKILAEQSNKKNIKSDIDYEIVKKNYKYLKISLIFFFSAISVLFLLPFIFNLGVEYSNIFDILIRIICLGTTIANIVFMDRIFSQTNEISSALLILLLILPTYYIAIIYTFIKCHKLIKQRNNIQKEEP